MCIHEKKFVLLLIFVSQCNGFNVLIATPTTIKSIHGLFTHIALELADAGHNVTFITPYALNKEHPNIEMLRTPQVLPITNFLGMFNVKLSKNLSTFIHDNGPKYVHAVWSDERVMSLWKRRKDFDLFITSSHFSELTFPFLFDSNATFVQVCTASVESVSLSYEGNWLTPAVYPSFMVNYDEYMSFWERVINLPASFSYYFLQTSSKTMYYEAMKDYFPDINEKESYYDRVALTLINGHFALDFPVPLLPSQIEIGTINARKPKPLDKELAAFVEGSGDAGIIYFSLGSIAKWADIPQSAKEIFLEAFRRVPQKVLWKYEGKDLVLPPNVMIKKWMPQQDILGHPKTRVFISHCGTFGSQEAKYHGVPVLGVPISFDQPRNAARMERKGYAIVLQWEDLTTDKIVESLNTLINDTSYKNRLEVVSRVLHDQKETPAERAIWWLEYVVRHKGAPHLQYAGKRLYLFQYIMLDVILFWLSVFTVLIYCVAYAIKAICCGNRKKTAITKKHESKQKQQQQKKKNQ